jgi:hypothetical protein
MCNRLQLVLMLNHGACGTLLACHYPGEYKDLCQQLATAILKIEKIYVAAW